MVQCIKNAENPLCVDDDNQLERYINGKYMMLLLNNKRLNYDIDGKEKIESYSDIYWLPINTRSPVTSRFSFERTRVSYFANTLDEFMGIYQTREFV